MNDKKIKKIKKECLIFCGIFTITLIIFHTYLSEHFSSDTFEIMHLGYKTYINAYFLSDGRLFSCLLLYLADILKLSVNNLVLLSTILSLAISTISVLYLKNIILKYKKSDSKNELIAILISYCIVFNFMYIENLHFAEAVIMSISILLQIIASTIFINKGKNYYIKTLVLLLISIICYQGTITFFPLIVTVLLLIKYKFDYKKILIEMIKVIAIMCIVVAANFIIIKVIENITKTSFKRINNFNVINNIKIIFKNIFPFLIDTYEMFPKGLFIIILSCIILLSSFAIKQKEYKEMINIALIIIIAIASAVSPHIITLESFMVPRLMFNIGALIGIIFMYLYIEKDLFKDDSKYINKILIVILVAYTLINIINYMQLLYHQKQAKLEDERQCKIIDEWITQYENENNTKIKYIAICKDNNYTMQYKKDINIR